MIKPDDIALAFNNAGIDSPEALAAFANNFQAQLELQRVQIQIDSLASKTKEILKPIDDERIALQNKKADLAAQLGVPG